MDQVIHRARLCLGRDIQLTGWAGFVRVQAGDSESATRRKCLSAVHAEKQEKQQRMIYDVLERVARGRKWRYSFVGLCREGGRAVPISGDVLTRRFQAMSSRAGWSEGRRVMGPKGERLTSGAGCMPSVVGRQMPIIAIVCRIRVLCGIVSGRLLLGGWSVAQCGWRRA